MDAGVCFDVEVSVQFSMAQARTYREAQEFDGASVGTQTPPVATRHEKSTCGLQKLVRVAGRCWKVHQSRPHTLECIKQPRSVSLELAEIRPRQVALLDGRERQLQGELCPPRL